MHLPFFQCFLHNLFSVGFLRNFQWETLSSNDLYFLSRFTFLSHDANVDGYALFSFTLFFVSLNDNDWRSSLLRLRNRSKEHGRFAPAVSCESTLGGCSTHINCYLYKLLSIVTNKNIKFTERKNKSLTLRKATKLPTQI